ncbi:MAG TPA: hypothetical protein VH063_03270 [Gaiellaceae bacterium]|jgi:hypothetical protein|nr:hypothetical protein [Gaiellaceae bacterium]
MPELLIVVYEMYFATSDDLDQAGRGLADRGFEIEPMITQAPPSAPYGMRATIEPASNEEASARLHAALAGIPHDPIIHYQEQRLTEYEPDPSGVI